MEKRVVLAVVASMLLLVGFQMATAPYRQPPPEPVATTGTPSGGGEASTAPAIGNGGAAVVAPAVGAGAGGANPAPVAVPAVPAVPDEPNVETIVRSERVSLTFASHGATIRSARVWACAVHEVGDPEATGDPAETTDWFEVAPGLLATRLLGANANLAQRAWTSIEVPGADVAYTTDVPEYGVRLTKVFRLSRDPDQPYHLDVDVRLDGLGSGSQQGRLLTLEVVGPWLREAPLPLPEDSLLVARVGDDVDDISPGDVRDWLEEDAAYEQRAPDGLAWVGSRSDFHLGAVLPLAPLPHDATIGFLAASRQYDAETIWESAAPTIRVPVVMPTQGASQQLSFRYFVGPTSRPLLTDTDGGYHALVEAVPKRSFLITFGPIERALSWLLELIASTGMGYGLAIVCLTLVVRGMLFPLSRKSQVSMRVHAKKMGALKPKMDAIKAKYKDSRKQQEMTMKLMRQEKVSLLPGGCLLTFLQMPIWISLYGVLQTTYEMRHASFLWAADLTGPDHLIAIPFTEGWPVLDGWLNLFPLIMMVVWGISARMTPMPVDPQQAQQAKMMRWMPMLFGLFLYNFACGLTIYMTMSALWSIGEIQLIRRVWLKDL